MTIQEIVESKELKTVIEDYRGMCFWNVASDFFPRTRDEIVFALDSLDHYGTLDAYRRAGEIRSWL